MSKTFVVMKREFLEFVQTKTFLIATLLGPLLMVGFIALEVFILTRAGGGAYSLAVIDQSEQRIGQQFVKTLPTAAAAPMAKPTAYRTTLIERPANLQLVIDSLEQRVQADSLDGYLVVPPGILTGETARYYGSNATSQTVTNNLRGALQTTVHSTRLQAEGIDPSKVGAALAPVQLDAEKTGSKGVRGSAAGGQMIGMFMAFAMYLVVLLYGAAIMNGVLEEKRDKIVEVIVSSLRARDLMLGKVLGIAGAGLLQMFVWVFTVGIVLAYAASIATLLKLSPEKAQAFTAVSGMLPKVPLSVGVIFLLFFAGGFFLYSTIYATIGSIATTNQEAQQLVFPAIMPFIIGFLMSMVAAQSPDTGTAVAGSLIPFTSPLVMPIRAVAGSAGIGEIILSLALLVLTGLGILWVAAKIYRVGIFATGKRPTMAELGRWIRAS
ncbi:MAG TPA: ABC transporter permease [Longimicrobiales bacterium]|nr:ABC transporter permease [Longimicrobiales bacterium]